MLTGSKPDALISGSTAAISTKLLKVVTETVTGASIQPFRSRPKLQMPAKPGWGPTGPDDAHW